MAINKVIYGNQTLIDITDTTATATSVEQGQYFYDKTGTKKVGIGSALGHTTRLLPNGGTAHYITGVDLGNDTLYAGALASGYVGHDSNGNSITGTLDVNNLVDVSETTASAADVGSGKIFFN